MALVNFSNLDFDQIKTSLQDYLKANSTFTDCDFEGSIGDDIAHESVRLIRGKDILIVAATNKKRVNRLLNEMISRVLVEPKYSNTLNFKNDIVHIYTFDMTHMSNND